MKKKKFIINGAAADNPTPTSTSCSSSSSSSVSSSTVEQMNHEHSHSKNKNKNKKRLHVWIKWGACGLLSLLLLLISFFMGQASSRLEGNFWWFWPGNENASKVEVKIHWAGGEVIHHQPRDKNRDACDLLSDCFQSKYFLPDPVNSPSNPYKNCYSTLDFILKSYDSGFMFKGDRLVGFISSEVENGAKLHAPFSRISYYNVCIRKEDRGRGLAKQLIPEYTKLILDKRIPPMMRPAGHRIYAGLDVDFDTSMAVGAFALYAKMGFIRWWEPCSTIGSFDFNKLERQLSLANPKDGSEHMKPSLLFPTSQYFLRRKASLQSQIRASSALPVLSHFCMVKLLDEDDFGFIGRDIKDQVDSALKLKLKRK